MNQGIKGFFVGSILALLDFIPLVFLNGSRIDILHFDTAQVVAHLAVKVGLALLGTNQIEHCVTIEAVGLATLQRIGFHIAFDGGILPVNRHSVFWSHHNQGERLLLGDVACGCYQHIQVRDEGTTVLQSSDDFGTDFIVGDFGFGLVENDVDVGLGVEPITLLANVGVVEVMSHLFVLVQSTVDVVMVEGVGFQHAELQLLDGQAIVGQGADGGQQQGVGDAFGEVVLPNV